MHRNLNQKVPATAWARALQVPWQVTSPNHGFFLAQAGQVVGAYLAYYADRQVAGAQLRLCNLGAWCVLDSHRHQGLRLLTTLLKQPGYEFTDFSPSGSVIPLNRKLKFTELDTTNGAPVNGSFNTTASVDGPVRVLFRSPDGRRLYVGGEFQHVNGEAHHRLIALDPVTGQIDRTFHPVQGWTMLLRRKGAAHAIVCSSASVPHQPFVE